MKSALYHTHHLALCRETVSFHNDGPRIITTDYFATASAKRGEVYGSWHSGVLRILIPDASLQETAVGINAKSAAVTQGYSRNDDLHALEVLLNDGERDMLCIVIDLDLVDYEWSHEQHGQSIEVHAYSGNGFLWGCPGTFLVSDLPTPRFRQACAPVPDQSQDEKSRTNGAQRLSPHEAPGCDWKVSPDIKGGAQ